ncbi:MAG: hypothetical protein H6739_04855 [Alphaproteobacteria bacterium]|nr:hypothetical protein [Alphaproteobacteria bacterium]
MTLPPEPTAPRPPTTPKHGAWSRFARPPADPQPRSPLRRITHEDLVAGVPGLDALGQHERAGLLEVEAADFCAALLRHRRPSGVLDRAGPDAPLLVDALLQGSVPLRRSSSAEHQATGKAMKQLGEELAAWFRPYVEQPLLLVEEDTEGRGVLVVVPTGEERA